MHNKNSPMSATNIQMPTSIGEPSAGFSKGHPWIESLTTCRWVKKIPEIARDKKYIMMGGSYRGVSIVYICVYLSEMGIS